MLRRILFWTHLCTGCVAGVVIFIMCVTGLGLAFERQINNFADSYGRDAVKPGPVRAPIDQLIRTLPGNQASLTGITLSSDRNQPLAFAFGRERTIFVDPYSGRSLGENSKKSRAVFAALERWHRALGSELRGKGPSRWITDAANFAFLFLVSSGAVLWWPKKWTTQRLRSTALFRRNLSGKAALWNYHNVVGAWCAVPLFFVVLTGVIMSYSWATNALYRLTGSEPPPNGGLQERFAASPGQSFESHRARNSGGHSQNIQRLFDRAELQVAGWQSITLRMPAMRGAVFQIDRGNGGQPQKRDQLTLDATTGQVRRWEPFEGNSTGRRLRSWARFVHTGEAGGILGQFIAAIATLGGAVLVWTGLSMAWIRLRSRLSAKSEARTSLAEATADRR